MFDRLPGPGRDGFPGPGWDHPWWQGLLGWFVPLLLLLGFAALVVWAVLRTTQRRHPVPAAPGWPGPWRPDDAALEQARLRYARGETPREEFLQVSADLQGGTAGPAAGPLDGREAPGSGEEA